MSHDRQGHQYQDVNAQSRSERKSNLNFIQVLPFLYFEENHSTKFRRLYRIASLEKAKQTHFGISIEERCHACAPSPLF